jgi:organic hydroperoxide reductase OsmC/OhrA
MKVETIHSFDVKLKWDHESDTGLVQSGGRMPVVFGPPPEFGGNETSWSPEHLLVASVASCYVTTFIHFARLLKITVIGFRISGRADFEKGKNGLEATRIVLNPVVAWNPKPAQEVMDNLFTKAKKYCFVSNSLKCEVLVEPDVLQG